MSSLRDKNFEMQEIVLSADQLAKAQPNTFDLILLDDSNMENYGRDYEHALRLLRPRGIMLINDVS